MPMTTTMTSTRPTIFPILLMVLLSTIPSAAQAAQPKLSVHWEELTAAELHAAEQEYAVVFPEYYFGQIAEARHEPGTIAYSREMQLALLQETTDEMARNGCKKIIIANGHGGNEHLLPFFAQSQLDKPHDYVVYVFDERTPQSGGPAKKTKIDMHAGESETSKMMISRPDTVHLDRANQESGADQHRQNLPEDVYTGIWWYARFPNQV